MATRASTNLYSSNRDIDLKIHFKAAFLAGLLAIGSVGGVALADGAAKADAGAITISAKNFMFSPATITVKAGSTVTWTNMDDEAHTVASDTKLFRSAALDTNDHFSYKFDKAGTYHYMCTIHPRMMGTIVVQ
jgi:plastocyanin